MKKIITLLAVILACSLLLVGCNTHTCNFKSEWSYDETNHWHACDTCDKRGDESAHAYSWAFDDNNHWQECVCGSKTTAAAHVWGEGETIVTATEDNDGQIKYTCTCGKTKTEIVPRLDHTHVYGEWIQAKAPTCTEDGELAHYHCDKCGVNFDADKNEMANIVDAKLGHKLEVNITTEATVDSEGLATYTCQNANCNYSETLKIMRVPNVTINGNVASWSAVENATGYKAVVGDAETDLGDTLTYTIPVNAVTDGCKIVAYTTNEEYFVTSEKVLTFTTSEENLQASLNCDFGLIATVPASKSWGLYPYGNWSAQDYSIVTETNGNTCAKLQPYMWWPNDIILKKDASGNIVNVGTYVIAIDVKLGPNEHVSEGKIVFALAYDGGYRTIADVQANLANCTTDGWTTIEYEYEIKAEDNISSGWAQLDFTYWPEKDLTDNYVLIDNIRVYAKDDANKTNIDGLAGGDFEKFSTDIAIVPANNNWGLYPYGNWSPTDYTIITDNGNTCAKVQPKEWGVAVTLKKDCSVNIMNEGTYIIAIDVKLGPNVYVSEGKIVFGLAYADGGYKVVWDEQHSNLSSCTADGWATIEYEYTVTAEEHNNAKFAQLDFTYWPEKDLTDNYVLIDNIRVYAKDDANKTNIDGLAGGDFEKFTTFTENKWYISDTILIELNGIGSAIVNEDGNRVFKAYTNGITCEFDLKGNTEIANGGIYKMSLNIKLGADNQLFDSLGFTAWAWTTDDENAHQIVQNTGFGKLDTVGKDDYTTLEVYFTADSLANCKAINLFFWVGLNNGELQSANNYALIDNVTIQQVTIA